MVASICILMSMLGPVTSQGACVDMVGSVKMTSVVSGDWKQAV